MKKKKTGSMDIDLAELDKHKDEIVKVLAGAMIEEFKRKGHIRETAKIPQEHMDRIVDTLTEPREEAEPPAAKNRGLPMKIGETREFNGDTYVCEYAENGDRYCKGCAFDCAVPLLTLGPCSQKVHEGGNGVGIVFKKVTPEPTDKPRKPADVEEEHDCLEFMWRAYVDNAMHIRFHIQKGGRYVKHEGVFEIEEHVYRVVDGGIRRVEIKRGTQDTTGHVVVVKWDTIKTEE